jgi:transposase-like protein
MGLNCRFCGGTALVKAGVRRNKKHPSQRYACKQCRKRFVENNGFLRKRYSGEVIVRALDLYVKDVTLRGISTHIQEFYGRKPNPATIYRWIKHYSTLLDDSLKHLVPETGSTFHADELFVKTKYADNRLSYAWVVFDAKTKYNIATIVTRDRSSDSAMKIMQLARRNVERLPRVFNTDGLGAYYPAVEKYFPKKYVYHHTEVGINKQYNNNPIERYNNTQRTFLKNRRGLNYASTASHSFKLWNAYYNFVRRHQTLGESPSEAANINLGFKENESRWYKLIALGSNVIRVNLRNDNEDNQSQRLHQTQ